MIGGGAGSILHMIVTLKNNKNLLKRISPFKNVNRNKVRHLKHQDLKFKKFTKKEFKEFKVKLAEQIRNQNRKNILVLIFSILIGILIIMFIWLSLPNIASKWN
ncbi:MAG: hypothetical protein JEY96_03850 [Bacteroidales bacterium]|nr:hypothetical protein [Bacteroidales bacterium]